MTIYGEFRFRESGTSQLDHVCKTISTIQGHCNLGYLKIPDIPITLYKIIIDELDL